MAKTLVAARLPDEMIASMDASGKSRTQCITEALYAYLLGKERITPSSNDLLYAELPVSDTNGHHPDDVIQAMLTQPSGGKCLHLEADCIQSNHG